MTQEPVGATPEAELAYCKACASSFSPVKRYGGKSPPIGEERMFYCHVCGAWRPHLIGRHPGDPGVSAEGEQLPLGPPPDPALRAHWQWANAAVLKARTDLALAQGHAGPGRQDDAAPIKAKLATVERERDAARAEVVRLAAEVQQLDAVRAKLAHFETAYRGAERQLQAAQQELDRFRRGDLTAGEFDNFCHMEPKPLDARTFARSCAAYQRKLFGCAPAEDEAKNSTGAMWAAFDKLDRLRIKLREIISVLPKGFYIIPQLEAALNDSYAEGKPLGDYPELRDEIQKLKDLVALKDAEITRYRSSWESAQENMEKAFADRDLARRMLLTPARELATLRTGIRNLIGSWRQQPFGSESERINSKRCAATLQKVLDGELVHGYGEDEPIPHG